MTDTIYTIHRASDGAILATAKPGTVAETAQTVARTVATVTDGSTMRAYIHNGRGIVGAGIMRAGRWSDTLREDYERCNGTARAMRASHGYPIDPVPSRTARPTNTKTFAARFTAHADAVAWANLNGWTIQETEPLERGVWARFTS